MEISNTDIRIRNVAFDVIMRQSIKDIRTVVFTDLDIKLPNLPGTLKQKAKFTQKLKEIRPYIFSARCFITKSAPLASHSLVQHIRSLFCKLRETFYTRTSITQRLRTCYNALRHPRELNFDQLCERPEKHTLISIDSFTGVYPIVLKLDYPCTKEISYPYERWD